MARIPMTAAEQLRVAREAGHDLEVETAAARADMAHRGDTRYRLRCSCGWTSKWRSSRPALMSRIALHLGDVISDDLLA